MTIWTPGWAQGGTYNARTDRFSSRAEDWDEGVNDRLALIVAQRALGANLTVDVAAGDCIVGGDDQTGQGNYTVRSDAVASVTGFAATTGTNQRWDLVGVQINDPDAGGAAGTNATIVRVAGTQAAAASAVPPAVPNSMLLLAVVGPFTSSTSSITNAMIFDCWSSSAGAVPTNANAAASVARLLRGRRDAPGTIVQTVNAVAPNGWAVMAAQSLAVAGAGAKLAAHLPGQVSGGNVTVPDGRGRMLVAMDSQGGTDSGRLSSANTVLTAGGADKVTLTTAAMPYHAHGGVTNWQNQPHNHGPGSLGGATVTAGPHVHGEYSDLSLVGSHGQIGNGLDFTLALAGGQGLPVVGLPVELRPTTSTTGSTHGHLTVLTQGVTANESQPHDHNIPPEGGNGAHENMPPFLTVYSIIRL